MYVWNNIHVYKQKHLPTYKSTTYSLTCKITSSGNTMTLMYSNSCSRVRISFIGLLWDFLAMAQTPTTTCLPPSSMSGGPRLESLESHSSRSPYRKMEFSFNKLAQNTQNHVISKWLVVKNNTCTFQSQRVSTTILTICTDICT